MATTSTSCSPSAHKVKLSSNSNSTIALYEILIFSSGQNIALNATASQSSTHKQFVASNAIDDNLTSFTHTASDDKSPWLEVDLGSVREIDSVLIANRWCRNVRDPSRCLCRLSGARVSLLGRVDGNEVEVGVGEIGDACDFGGFNFTFVHDCEDSSFSKTIIHPESIHYYGRLDSDYGQSTHFSVHKIDRDDSFTSPAAVQIKIYNPKPATECWYSVTLLSYGLYTGSAVFLGSATENHGIPTIEYSWEPIVSGEYQVLIHELDQSHGPTSEQTKLPPVNYKFVIKDKPGHNSKSSVRQTLRRLPPCQTVGRHDLYSKWGGSWIGPSLLQNHTSFRTGWYFLPNSDMNCKLDIFTVQDISLLSEEKSILILGTSRERGVFLSLVDMLLDTKEKLNINESVIAKCWGRAHVSKYNLKIFYQDWRAQFFSNDDSSQPSIICHDDNVARETNFFTNAIEVWDEIFQNQASLPSVVLMFTGKRTESMKFHYDVNQLISKLPHDWNGTLFLTDYEFSAARSGRGSVDDFKHYREGINQSRLALNDSRVRWIDGMGISKDMRLYGEFGEDGVAKSEHFHHICNIHYDDGIIKVCSNITELLGQLLLSHALGPKDDFIKETIEKAVQQNQTHVMEYCHACPNQMLPFHITPHPSMTCAKTVLHPRVQNEIMSDVPEKCPEKCMGIPVSNYVKTMSNTVKERVCPLNYFMNTSSNSEMIHSTLKSSDAKMIHPDTNESLNTKSIDSVHESFNGTMISSTPSDTKESQNPKMINFTHEQYNTTIINSTQKTVIPSPATASGFIPGFTAICVSTALLTLVLWCRGRAVKKGLKKSSQCNKTEMERLMVV